MTSRLEQLQKQLRAAIDKRDVAWQAWRVTDEWVKDRRRALSGERLRLRKAKLEDAK